MVQVLCGPSSPPLDCMLVMLRAAPYGVAATVRVTLGGDVERSACGLHVGLGCWGCGFERNDLEFVAPLDSCARPPASVPHGASPLESNAHCGAGAAANLVVTTTESCVELRGDVDVRLPTTEVSCMIVWRFSRQANHILPEMNKSN